MAVAVHPTSKMQLVALAATVGLLWVGLAQVNADDDDFMDFNFDDLDGDSHSNGVGTDSNGDEATPCDPKRDTLCVNASSVAPEVRHPDRLVQQLIVQVWNDFSRKLREDARLYDTTVDPLDVDSLLKRPIALKQAGSVYQADVKMHNISVLGLSDLTMDAANATRSENLTSLSVRVVIKCPLIAVKGRYSLKGTFGWWVLDSQGVQNFHISLVNVSLSVSASLEVSQPGDAAGKCGPEARAHLASMEMPLAYDDVDFRFDKLGSFANQVVNGVGVYFLQTQEELIVDKIKSTIRTKAKSLIC